MTRKVAPLIGCLSRPQLILIAAILSAPALQSRAEDPAFPFTGSVTSDRVEVYAGASTNYYSVATLKQGDLVRVHDNLFGWYKIDPPPGTYCLIAKEFVEASADGTTGTVRGARVRVKAPSPTGPDDSYRTQMLADQGLVVRIIGDEGSYFRITPPEGARLFVQARDIAPATQQQLADVQAAQQAAENAAVAATPQPTVAQTAVAAQPAAAIPAEAPPARPDAAPLIAAAQPQPTSTAAATTPAPAETAAAPVTVTASAVAATTPTESPAVIENPAARAPDNTASIETAQPAATPEPAEIIAVESVETVELPAPVNPLDAIDTSSIPNSRLPIQPDSPALRDLEKKLLAIGEMPPIDQPLSSIRIAYERLSAGGELSSRDRALLNARLEQIAYQQGIQTALIDITVTQQSLADSAKRRADRGSLTPPDYIAVGRLHASSLYDGVKLPLLYRVANPLNGLTIAYVRPTDSSPDLRLYIGEYVGITGRTETNPGIKVTYIIPYSIDTLSPQTETAAAR